MRLADPLPMYRIAFNPDLPVVASATFRARGRSFAAGEVVDWRAMGVSGQKLLDWWRAGMVSHPTKAKPVGAIAQGDVVSVPAVSEPAPKRKRRGR